MHTCTQKTPYAFTLFYTVYLLYTSLVNCILLCTDLRSLLTTKTTLNARRKSMLFTRYVIKKEWFTRGLLCISNMNLISMGVLWVSPLMEGELILMITEFMTHLSIIFILASEPQGMDQEGDLQHCRMWQVLQWSHHYRVCSWDLGRGAHAWETPRPWWQALNCPHDGQHPSFHCAYHNLASGKSPHKPASTGSPVLLHCISHKPLGWLSLYFSYLHIHNIQVIKPL